MKQALPATGFATEPRTMAARPVSARRSMLAALMGAFLLIAGFGTLFPAQLDVRADGMFDGLEQLSQNVLNTFDQLRGNKIRSGVLCGDAEGLKLIRTQIDNRKTAGERTGVTTPRRKDGNTNTQNYHLTTKLISCMVSPVPGDGSPVAGPGFPKGKPGYVVYYGKKLVAAVSTLFVNILTGIALLAVIVFGIRVALGFGHELQSAAIILVFKIGLLFFALGSMPYLYEATINTMNGMSGNIAAAIPTDMCHEIDAAKAAFRSGGEDRMFMLPWVKLDCSVEAIATVLLDDRNSPFGTMITAAVSGNMGKALAASFFATAFTLFNALNLAVFIVVLANLAVVLMFMVAPIAWVCVMFKQTTKYFHNWLRIVIGFVLQPILLALFMMMMISAFEQVMCKQQFSVVASFNAIKHGHFSTTGGSEPTFISTAVAGTDYGPAWCTREKMREAMAQDMISPDNFSALATHMFTPSPDVSFLGGVQDAILGKAVQLRNDFIKQMMDIGGFNVAEVATPQIVPKLVPRLGLPFLSMLAAFTVMFVLYAFLQQIPNFINQLASSAVASGNLNQIRMPGKAKEVMGAMDQATSGFNTGGMAAFGNARRGMSGIKNSENKSGGE